MNNINLFTDCQVIRVNGPEAAGTTDINTAEVDMQGWESIMWIASFGTITATAVTSMHAEQTSVSGSGYADLEGTQVVVADTDDDQHAILDLVKPEERYVRLVIDRGTANAVVDNVIAILYDKKGLAPDNDNATTIDTSKVVVSPEEGTP